jgi:hypothetical protein
MVIAPERAFTIGHLLAAGDVVPAIGAVVDRVEEESLVLGFGAQVGFVEERVGDGEGGLAEVGAGACVAMGTQPIAEAQESLGGDGGGGAIDGFPWVKGIGGAAGVIPEAVEVGGPRIPEGDAIGGGVLEVELGGGEGRPEEGLDDSAAAAERGEFAVAEGLSELELFGETAQGPGETPGPGGERGVTLLRVGAAVGAVGGVEDGFVGGPAGYIIGVAPFAVVDVMAGCVPGMFDEAAKQRDRFVLFGHERMAEAVSHAEHTAGSERIDEERVRAIEGVDETGAVGGAGPAGGLHSAADLEGEFVKILFARVVGNTAFAEESEEVAVGGDIVEAVVVDADVRDMRGHALDGVAASEFEELIVAGGVELQDGGAELEALGPLGPAAGGVAAGDGEDGRAVGRVPRGIEAEDLLGGELEQAFKGTGELSGSEVGVGDHADVVLGFVDTHGRGGREAGMGGPGDRAGRGTTLACGSLPRRLRGRLVEWNAHSPGFFLASAWG